MYQDVQQFVLLDTLLSNWDGIRIRMGPLSPAFEKELAAIAARLTSTCRPEEIAPIVLGLLKLTRDTPANEYVRDLVARANYNAPAISRSRESPSVGPAKVEPLAMTEQTSQALGAALSADSVYYSIPVFFATNRNSIAANSREESFGGELAKELQFGQANVTIPVDKHRVGRVETPHRWTLFPNKDREKRFVVFDNFEPLNQNQFTGRLAQAIPADQPQDLLVFLHGYNVTFESAVRRAAQFSHDVDFPGVIVLFSWPSLGRPWDYAADGSRAEASATSLVKLLELLQDGRWNKVHLLAHSMGNRVLLSALADFPRPPVPLREIVFMAADVEVNIFEQKFGRSVRSSALITSYASKVDRALSLSAWIHRAARIGFIDGEPFVTDGLETVDASFVDTSLLGHSYFSDDRALLTDLGILLREGFAAERRGLRLAPGKKYWRFAR
jgi:esterase/lipase superfamily enzyme